MGVTIRQIEDPLHELRHIKSPEECELMSKASHIISDVGSENYLILLSSNKTSLSYYNCRLSYRQCLHQR